MAAPGNPNQPGGGGGPFDVHKFFNPAAVAATTNPNNIQNPNLNSHAFPQSPAAVYPPPLPSASYPPATGSPYSYQPLQSTNPLYHHQFHIPTPFQPQPPSGQGGADHLATLQHQQRSVSYPTPPLQPPAPTPNNPNPNNPNHGARLMALLSAPPPSTMEIPPQLPTMPMPLPPQNPNLNPPLLQVPLHSAATPMIRMPSSKLPKGRHLIGDQVVYDIDVRMPGEVQPQLEVTPITKYGSDPGLVVGRQIAVNKTYICYGLKLGAVRVLNINTALRSLLKGLMQRVTDMAFFAEDVHLLAGASIDGRVYIWKLTEGPDEDDKAQITGKIVIAIQIIGGGESVHPRVCWHCHKQEVLVVGTGRHILKIDTTKVSKGEVFSADDPLKCPIEKLIDGVQFVGSHDGEVTDLSMCQWMTTRLVSASVDGTIKIWEDRKSQPIAVLRPHDGLPVNSVTFLTSPHRPDHIILITGGPLNREVKLWASESDEGWLLPSDADSWHCTQTLELKSSAESRVEDAFFNQVVALSQAGLLLLANAKKNAIYAVHLEYGANPNTTRMDYVAEFTVTMPILSFTGTSDLLPHGEQIVQVYCVQTQAIQQYALDLSQCLPPPTDNVVFEKTDSSFSRDAISTEGFSPLDPSGGKSSEIPLASSATRPYESSIDSAPILRHPLSSPSVEAIIAKEVPTSSMESKSNPSIPINDADISRVASPSIPLSPRLSRKLSDFRSQSSSFEPAPQINDYSGDQKIIEYSVDRQIDNVHTNVSDIPSSEDDLRNDENKGAKVDSSTVLEQPIKFKHPTHLVTPSEILMATSSTEINHVTEHKSEGEQDLQDVVVNSDTQNVEVEVKVVGETGFGQNADIGSQGDLHSFASEHKEKSFCSQASDLGIEMARDSRALPGENFIASESKQLGAIGESKVVIQASSARDEVLDAISGQIADTVVTPTVNDEVYVAEPPVPSGKGKKQKGKNAQGSSQYSPSPGAFNSTDSSTEPEVTLSVPSAQGLYSQFQAMQEMLTQLTSMQMEMQKQMPMMLATPISKESRRLEAIIAKSLEKAVKNNNEDNAKQEKLFRDRMQQITSLVSNSLNKDLPAMLEKIVKKELAAVGTTITRALTPALEKAVSTAISDSFQRGVGDKAVNQLEKSVSSKLEATVARQIQVQFQTSGKQALQETLKSSLEASVVPAFEMSCKAMFDQVDATFQKGMVEHTTATQQQFESAHSPLAIALRDAISSASSMTQTLSSELAEGQRRLVALAVAGANSKALNPLIGQISNGPIGSFHEKIEEPLDPTKELSRLVYEHKYEEAFTSALQRSDVRIVSWLCTQVDLQGILTSNPLPLSQGVLLSLLQQLACDISNDTVRKVAWMTDVVVAIKPSDQMIAMHVRPIFDQVYSILNHQVSLPTTSVSELSSIRVIMRIINSTQRSL